MRNQRYQRALAGLQRCNGPAVYVARNNGYKLCEECYATEGYGSTVWIYMPADGPGPWGKCDRPIDGYGSMSWRQRLARA